MTPRGSIRVRLIERAPWLLMLRWWHIGVLLALVLVAAVGWRLLTPAPVAAVNVLATVDGVPITDSDLAAEAQSRGVAVDGLDDAARKGLLTQIVDRRLLAAAARKRGIESDPVFRATAARAGEMIAASVTAQEFTGAPEPASDAEAMRYIVSHPLVFAQRQILSFDGVITELSPAAKVQVKDADSVNEVVAMLRVSNTPFEPVHREFDTASIPPEMASRMLQAKPGDLFQLPANGKALIGAVTGRRPMVVPEADQMAAARSAATQQRQETRLSDAIATLRKNAVIHYVNQSPAP